MDDDSDDPKTIFESDEYKSKYTVIRGLIKYRVLLYCLSKTWSRDYGSRSNTNPIIKMNGMRKSINGGFYTLLAVPYLALDTPSPTSFFSHPDVTIILTLLTYYYQGLSYSQFRDALIRLVSTCNQQKKNDIYRSWIRIDENIPFEFHSLQSIVLSNDRIVNQLYQYFKYNIKVINFWLNELVFPFETKQHPEKLYSSAWDIVSGTHTVGFSGTNDTSILYPLSIKQEDLPSLLYTNTEVFNYILNQEDNQVHFIPQNCSILDRVTKTDTFARVFIDSGALMIGMTNFQVAKSFLEKTDPNDKKLLFHQSPYANRLDRVIVYLDDYHTRGVNIKFEKETHAIVTVGPRMTKDKFIQACMRMRKLGFGQTVSFMVSEHLGVGTNVLDLFKWVIKNTIRVNEKQLMRWMVHGCHFYRTHYALKLHDLEGLKLNLLQFSSLSENNSLIDMYQPQFVQQDIKVVAHKLMLTKTRAFKSNIDGIVELTSDVCTQLNRDHKQSIQDLEKRIKDIGDNITIFASADHDGEDERENDFEEEKEDVQIQETVVPAEPKTSQKLLNLISSREQVKRIFYHPTLILEYENLIKCEKYCILPIESIYYKTPIWKLLTKDNTLTKIFDNRIWVTSDFVYSQTSVKNPMDYNRLFNYVLILWDEKRIIVLSQNDANAAYICIQELWKSDDSIIRASLHQTRAHTVPNQREYLQSVHTKLPDDADFDSIHELIVQLNIINGSKCFNDNLQDTCKFLGIRQRIESNEDTMDTDENEDEVDRDGFIKSQKARFNGKPFQFLELNYKLNRVFDFFGSDIAKVLPKINK
ncbi:predicted protein [Heterostelium album PN500]|uniref:ubiquitinyl hydrolase 1 n=1 Tax=Heterostelium pallidum (strain ATCC 26659 / Pp 5 / PN500) TaxID=670386 RepID=D3BPQ2_HETP5|nr:predicted protein [Heterostelium album PN500]EFA76614.1 predicted protein [Heterostelium album PN500]|eukprot:XP_020428746.1 predicted protein [Heterostelium album PN500]